MWSGYYIMFISNQYISFISLKNNKVTLISILEAFQFLKSPKFGVDSLVFRISLPLLSLPIPGEYQTVCISKRRTLAKGLVISTDKIKCVVNSIDCNQAVVKYEPKQLQSIQG